MKNNDKEKLVINVISSMKLRHLKHLAKIFEIQIKGNRKENYIEHVAQYSINNISAIVDNFITYEEYKFIKILCDENYTMILKNESKKSEEIQRSLGDLGLVYSYLDSNEKTISIPVDIRENIKSKISNTKTIDYLKKKQNLIDVFKELLDIYGMIPQNVLIDYMTCIDFEYRVCENIKILWRYNFRYNLYYDDYKLNYYNTKIIDRESFNQKLINKLNLNYKYYNLSQLKKMSNEGLNSIEGEICFILKRYYKSMELILEYLNNIRLMVKNDISSKEISNYVMKKTNKMSEQGKKNIEQLVDNLRECYPLWTLKGHYLKDLEY